MLGRIRDSFGLWTEFGCLQTSTETRQSDCRCCFVLNWQICAKLSSGLLESEFGEVRLCTFQSDDSVRVNTGRRFALNLFVFVLLH